MTIIRWYSEPDTKKIFFRNATEGKAEKQYVNHGTMPLTNIRKGQDYYMIEMAVAGRKKEDFKIDLDKNMLIVSTEENTANNQEPQSVRYLRKEFNHDSFKRHFHLPETTDIEKIFARYENGILSISIPFENPELTRVNKSIQVN